MTQAWAIKGPDWDIQHVVLDADESSAWLDFIEANPSIPGSVEKLKQLKFTCVRVTITEGSAEPVGYVAESEDGLRGIIFADAKVSSQDDLFTAPPADKSRALLKACLPYVQRDDDGMERTGSTELLLVRCIKDYLSRSRTC